MSLIATDLRDLIKSKVIEKIGEDYFDETNEKVILAVAEAYTEWITGNAVVNIDNPTLLVDTAGNPPSPSHTGTATGKIS